MKYRDTPANVSDQVRALEVLEGYPVKPSFVGSALRGLVPESYAEGVLGWTDKMAEPVPIEGSDEVEVDLPDAVVAKHRGKSIDVKGKRVVVNIPEKPGKVPDNKPKK
jgi:hypothetical protein